MVGVRIIPHLWEKKQEKKKNLTTGKLILQGNTKMSAFLLHMESLCFFKSKATTLGRI